jgi:hypothetical protein
MRDAFTMRFRPEVAEFVQAQASAGNRSVTCCGMIDTIWCATRTRMTVSMLSEVRCLRRSSITLAAGDGAETGSGRFRLVRLPGT